MITRTGFKFDVSTDALNDMELLDAIVEMQESPADVSPIVRVLTIVLGKEGKKRLYDHVRTEDGRVPVDKVAEELADIFNALGDSVKK